MRSIRSVALSALTAATLVLSVSACQLGDEAGDTEEIIIGADLELSGPTATIGQAYQRALVLKIDQVNDSGVLGNRKLKLDAKDNRSDPSLSLSNVGEFANNPKVAAVVMGVCGDCVVGAAKTLNDRKIPTIALAPASNVVTPVAERRWIFKVAPNAADSAAALTSELQNAGKKTVGLLYSDDAYGKEGRAALEDALRKAGIEVVAAGQVKSTDTDVSQPMATILAEQPDAIVVWTFADQANLAAASARQDDYQGSLYFDAAAAGDLFLSGQAATNGATMIFTQTMVIDDVIATTPAKAARKQWFRDYTAKYGSYYGFSSFAADAVQMVTNALQGATTVNRDSVRAILETSQFDGISGPIRITPDNHSGLMPQALTVLVARSGRWRLAG
ncbi:ABC transporter substrate-binding protein [Phytohabitans rumicis]|uniref:Branched-chain amino acid ABC transporter n=1 Tax=Phytohabitans rumicis TaxID=1076125 RepID=A0A6V8KXG8_9ACTN|nr:ABC transporter substrate-binding protein [Phytohabitans rumicis]GFJ89772.1 branched-chain amino acid ABC transporter [Phytohabitans rumicis]